MISNSILNGLLQDRTDSCRTLLQLFDNLESSKLQLSVKYFVSSIALALAFCLNRLFDDVLNLTNQITPRQWLHGLICRGHPLGDNRLVLLELNW